VRPIRVNGDTFEAGKQESNEFEWLFIHMKIYGVSRLANCHSEIE
jgi:hypothetical protein